MRTFDVPALAEVRAKTAYLGDELCGVGGWRSQFAEAQAATDGARRALGFFYAFDRLHIDGVGAAPDPLR